MTTTTVKDCHSADCAKHWVLTCVVPNLIFIPPPKGRGVSLVYRSANWSSERWNILPKSLCRVQIKWPTVPVCPGPRGFLRHRNFRSVPGKPGYLVTLVIWQQSSVILSLSPEKHRALTDDLRLSQDVQLPPSAWESAPLSRRGPWTRPSRVMWWN